MPNDESISVDIREFAGRSWPELRQRISADHIRDFRAAAGAPGPDDVAPATYLTIFRKGEFGLLAELGIPLKRVLHAEQEYSFNEPVRAGQELAFVSRISQAAEKSGKSGKLQFVTFETVFYDVSREPRVAVATSRSLLVARYPAEGAEGKS